MVGGDLAYHMIVCSKFLLPISTITDILILFLFYLLVNNAVFETRSKLSTVDGTL